MRRLALTAICALALAGCAENAGPAGPASIPFNNTAGPGAGFMAPFDAGVIFADSCLVRGTRFQDAVEGLRVHNFTHNPQLGTYYHNTNNLSVKVTADTCSMVFASKKQIDETVADLAKGTASIISKPPRSISVTSHAANDGLRYFRIGIKAPVELP